MSEHNGPTGHPKDQTAEPFKTSATPARNQMPPDAASPVESAAGSGSEGRSSLTAQGTFGPLSLSPDQIEAPSFFVNQKLTVAWMNPSGTDAFSHALAKELNSASTGNIFDLLLKPAIKRSMSDWQAFFSFVYVLLRRSTDKGTFDRGTVSFSSNHLPDMEAEPPATHPLHHRTN